MNQLEQLRKMTVVVADTGDINAIKKWQPTDATTNPSLIMKAATQEEYRPLIEDALRYSKRRGASSKEQQDLLLAKLFVNFGAEILKIIPGRVSTEVDAHLSFDVEGSLDKAHQFISLYEEMGIERDRILIKLASTWEGMVAARELESEGIHCNMTLMFSLIQAVAAAEAGATLISPFVGRILDWYKKNGEEKSYSLQEDPGVQSVQQIYHYLKYFNHKTEVMAASFRNKEEVLELAGCDLLTISPHLLEEIASLEGELPRKLRPSSQKIERLKADEKQFRWLLNQDAMATEKLAEGIRNFAKDADQLKETLLREFP